MKKIKKWWKNKSNWFKVPVVTFILLLILVRTIAPTIIKLRVLSKLNKIEGFNATIENVDVSFFSPSITFNNLKLFSTFNPSVTPLFTADVIKGELLLCSLNQGELLTHSTIINPTLTFLQFDDTTKLGKLQSSTNYINSDRVSWGKEIGNLFALSINEFDIKNGSIFFIDKQNKQEIKLSIDQITTSIKNIANVENKNTNLFSSGQLTARLMQHAPLEAAIKMAPSDKNAPFDLDVKLNDLDITSLNDFWRAYVNLDVEQGHFNMHSHITSRDGIIKGVLKPYSSDFEIFNLKYDENLGLKNMTWQALIGLATKILLLADNNQDKICKVSFEGDLTHLDITLQKNSEVMLSKLFVKTINSKLSNHTIYFDEIE